MLFRGLKPTATVIASLREGPVAERLTRGVGSSAFATPAARQMIQNSSPAATAGSKIVGVPSAATRLNLAIGLPLRNRELLTNFLGRLYDSSSPQFHRYLTPDEFTARFGPTTKDYAAVIEFAHARGLKVTGTHPNRMLVDVSGTVSETESAFHVIMRNYQPPTGGRVFFAPDRAPSLDLSVPVLGISGLDNSILARPMNLKTHAWDAATNITTYITGSGPGGFFIGNDFRAAYAPGVTLTGAGQAVGLFELDGYYASDIVKYESLARLPAVPLTNVLVNAYSGAAGANNLEVALDIDMAISMAPGLARVIVYEGLVPDDVLNRMATDNLANQLSSSWGFGPLVDPVRDQIFLEFAAQGQSMFQASGDSGAYPGAIYPPSDNPDITVVGGTSLTTSGPGGAWAAETVWPGSGGGISGSYAIPAWQQAIDMSANHGSTAWRNIPDVACLADVALWLVANNGEQGGIGGTSAATPLWAGFTALVNQQAAANGRPPVGFLNPAIYAIGGGNGFAAGFHDIVSGNTTNSDSPANFFAIPGYDLCTGWGSPTGSKLIQALAAPPDALRIFPGSDITFARAFGGPFDSAAQTVWLTNSGASTLGWAVANKAPWLAVDPLSGSLAAGGISTPVNLSLTPAVTNLSVGEYIATLWFTNLSDGYAQSREVILDVVSPPVISSQPVGQSVPLGGAATFTVGTVANPLQSYQWWGNGHGLTNGGNIDGATASSLTISNATLDDAGNYFVVISNRAGSVVSDTVTLAITSSPPVILTQPASQTAIPGATVVFTVAVAGDQPMFYQWRANGTNLPDGGNVSGPASNILTISNVLPDNAAGYSVVVSNALGTVASAVASLAVVSGSAPGVTLSTLYSFTGGTDGGYPNELAPHPNGSFYGTTQTGGTNSSGTVFQWDTNGVFTTLARFDGATGGGSVPAAGLAAGGDGALYGTTARGGALGWGTAFRITTNGALASLVDLTYADGVVPQSRMIQLPDGYFYGTTANGGGGGAGTVFRLATNGTFTVLTAFNYTNGFQATELLPGADGLLYGTSLVGGLSGDGTVFKVTTNGVLTSLHSFNYTNGGFIPFGGLVQTADGNFYGTTYEGGEFGYGTVFEMSPAGFVTTIYSFGGGSDGGHPAARLAAAADGNFYGTTAYGGAYNQGTVFRMPPTGELLTLAEFDGFNGANPENALVQDANGDFYGTAQSGGASGNGVIFRVTIDLPTLQITSQPLSQSAFVGAGVVLSVAVAGNAPLGYQWRKNGTDLGDGSGVTGSSSRVLRLSNLAPADAGFYSVVISNTTSRVGSDDALIEIITSPPQIVTPPARQNVLVGATVKFSVVAIGDLPLSYQWRRNGTSLNDGGQISGAATDTLTIASTGEGNDGVYDVRVANAIGAVTSPGAVLSVHPASAPGTLVTTLHTFAGGNDGRTPNGLMTAANGLLYGTTEFGGRIGTVFTVTTNGVLTTLSGFGPGLGFSPVATLVQGADGNFYGSTEFGGTNAEGNIFEMSPAGAITNLYSFSGGEDGGSPSTALVRGLDGNFYGTTEAGGVYGAGNVFEISPAGFFTNLYSFTGGADGNTPGAAVIAGVDGNFYGTTRSGGAYSAGTVFKLAPDGALTTLYSFSGTNDGANPNELVAGGDGYIYGTTQSGGIPVVINGLTNYPNGTIFKLGPGGTVTNLHFFASGGGGGNPLAALTPGDDGNYYGTTQKGGESLGYGTVFRLAPNGAFAVLLSFNGADDGQFPQTAMAMGPDGFLYGTTPKGGATGGGVVFQLAFTSAPQITTDPANQSVFAGMNVELAVAVFGRPPLFYQWRKDGTNLLAGSGISGSTDRILRLAGINLTNAGAYSVMVSNALGVAVSGAAILKVQVPPPVLRSVTVEHGAFSFSWSSVPGTRYQVQSATDVFQRAWSDIGGVVSASGLLTTATQLITGSQQFYRVQVVP